MKAFVFSWSFLAKVINGESFVFEPFWPRIPTVKVLVFSWSFLARVNNSESFGWSWSFLAKVTNGESFCFSWTFLAKVAFIGHFGYEYQ